MNREHFELLTKSQDILARMPREFSSTKAALALRRAIESDELRAEEVLMRQGLREIAAELIAAAFALRSTGHFVTADTLDQCAALLQSWERRRQPRISGRYSGEAS